MEPERVYLLFIGDYDDNRVLAVCSTPEIAMAHYQPPRLTTETWTNQYAIDREKKRTYEWKSSAPGRWFFDGGHEDATIEEWGVD